MAEKNLYVHQNLNGQKVINANLERVGIQTFANLTAINAYGSGTLVPASETKRIAVFDASSKVIYVWDGVSAFEKVSGGAAGDIFDIRGNLTPTTQIAAANNVNKGDVWIVTTAGLWYNTTDGNASAVDPGFDTGEGILLEIGDIVIYAGPITGEFATDAQLGAPANWIALQKNIDAATETTLGLARLASNADMVAGTSAAPTPAFISPEKLAYLKDINSAYKYFEVIATLTLNTPTTVTHNLNTKKIQVTVTDSNDEEIGVLVDRNGANTIQITSNVTLTNVNVYVSAL